MTAEPALLAVRGITKRFGGTLALDDVDMEVRVGEIHALLGENGAGKSTLIKILAGVHVPDSGDICSHGQSIDPSGQALPIAFIHQELALFESMTVAENIGLVDGYPRSLGAISWSRLIGQAREALAFLGSSIDPAELVASLSAAEKSIVAIARGLAQQTARVLVLDEPTASLPETDVARLFDALRALRQLSVAMIYVTHRLDEVFRIADRVTVLRDGRRISTADVSETTPAKLILEIVGRSPSEVFAHAGERAGEAVLELQDVSAEDAGPVTMAVSAGEIVALVGLRGAGHDTIGRAIFGAKPLLGGGICLRGQRVRLGGPSDAVRLGIGFVSGKRADEGLADSMCIRENLYLNPAVGGRGSLKPISRRGERRQAVALLTDFDIRPRDSERIVHSLSGGNQQKVVVARWLGTGCRVLVLEDPTVGVDVGAKAEIYRMLTALVADGGCIALVSSDFEEVAGLANRALVFSRGRVVAELGRDRLSVSTLTHYASGGDHQLDDPRNEMLA